MEPCPVGRHWSPRARASLTAHRRKCWYHRRPLGPREMSAVARFRRERMSWRGVWAVVSAPYQLFAFAFVPLCCLMLISPRRWTIKGRSRRRKVEWRGIYFDNSWVRRATLDRRVLSRRTGARASSQRCGGTARLMGNVSGGSCGCRGGSGSYVTNRAGSPVLLAPESTIPDATDRRLAYIAARVSGMLTTDCQHSRRSRPCSVIRKLHAFSSPRARCWCFRPPVLHSGTCKRISYRTFLKHRMPTVRQLRLTLTWSTGGASREVRPVLGG